MTGLRRAVNESASGWSLRHAEVLRWLVVGVLLNVALYLMYLALTRRLLEPRLAMTVCYVAGVLLGFASHRALSFRHRGAAGPALGRYLVAYLVGYLVNLVGLHLGIAVLGVPHEIAQAVLVLVVAGLMFLMQRHFVFRDQSASVAIGSESQR